MQAVALCHPDFGCARRPQHRSGFALKRRLRMSCGALTTRARNWLIAGVFALTARHLATEIVRMASAAPD